MCPRVKWTCQTILTGTKLIRWKSFVGINAKKSLVKLLIQLIIFLNNLFEKKTFFGKDIKFLSIGRTDTVLTERHNKNDKEFNEKPFN